jgi:hypothetical protein
MSAMSRFATLAQNSSEVGLQDYPVVRCLHFQVLIRFGLMTINGTLESPKKPEFLL